MSFDLHRFFQELMTVKADVMCGYQITAGERESRTHIQVDYFCIADRERPHRGPERGIRPFADFARYNVIELEGMGRTLSESRFRYHLGRALVMENPAGQSSRQGEIGLTILAVHKPVKLLKEGRYGFERVTPWKYRARILFDLPVTIIILRELQQVDGGEPLAWLQILEPDPNRRAAVWSHILAQKMTGQDQLKSLMMEMDKEAFMTIAEELRAEGRQVGLQEGRQVGLQEGRQVGLQEGRQMGMEEGQIAGILKAKAEIARNMLRNGCDIPLILEVTGLSPAQMDTLRVELGSPP